MNETPLLAQNRLVFFVSRLLIMAGMVLVFAGLSSLAGYLIAKPFGIDITKLNIYVQSPEVYPREMVFIKIFQIIASIGTFVVPAFLFPRAIAKYPPYFLNLKKPTGLYAFFLAFLAIALALPFVSNIYELNKNITFPAQWADIETYLRQLEENTEQITNSFTATNTFSELLLNIFVISIIPAFAEEIFFRGCLQNFVKMVFYNIHIAVLFSAIIFSGFHGQFFGFLPRVALGVVLGYLFAYSNNIWVPVFGHFINNFFALLSVYLYKKYPHWEMLANDYTFPVWVVVISTVLCIAIIYMLSHLRFRHLEAHE
ncbi:MAG: lysostaphin resistance A-like protein [Bacteroidia bacterium]